MPECFTILADEVENRIDPHFYREISKDNIVFSAKPNLFKTWMSAYRDAIREAFVEAGESLLITRLKKFFYGFLPPKFQESNVRRQITNFLTRIEKA